MRLRCSGSLTATRPGYADGAFGRLRPSGPSQAIELADGQKTSDVTVQLWKLAAIGGTVIDENGEPVVGTTVRVLRRVVNAGKRQLQMGASDTTDDRGMYRIGSLEPEHYADIIAISGYDGGTGAARKHALRHVGMPVEIGVKEAHRALLKAGLRNRVEVPLQCRSNIGSQAIRARHELGNPNVLAQGNQGCS